MRRGATFDLDAYEELVALLQPGIPSQDTAQVTSRQIVFSPATLSKEAGNIRLSATVDVPADYPRARFAVLLEPNQEIRGVKADATDAGKPLALFTENGGRGIWYWYWADLAPGKHLVELTIHSAAPGRLSGWLLTRRATTVAARGFAEPDLLPAQSNIERGTHLILEETIR